LWRCLLCFNCWINCIFSNKKDEKRKKKTDSQTIEVQPQEYTSQYGSSVEAVSEIGNQTSPQNYSSTFEVQNLTTDVNEPKQQIQRTPSQNIPPPPPKGQSSKQLMPDMSKQQIPPPPPKGQSSKQILPDVKPYGIIQDLNDDPLNTLPIPQSEYSSGREVFKNLDPDAKSEKALHLQQIEKKITNITDVSTDVNYTAFKYEDLK